jgi:hypothetical protein
VFTLLIFALLGVILLLTSVAIPHDHIFAKDFTRELGIVLLAVCGVSIIYEIFVAEKHFEKFSASLQKQIERGETNAATCERLGILRIYPTRHLFETNYPLDARVSAASVGSRFCIIGRSLLQLMMKGPDIKRALTKGVKVELCCFDPSKALMPAIAGFGTSDISATLARFIKEFGPWLADTKPCGSLQLRFHGIDLFDSYFAFSFDGRPLINWDLSFGAEVADKRIILLDSTKGLGADLDKRYRAIWDAAAPKFIYENGETTLDELQAIDLGPQTDLFVGKHFFEKIAGSPRYDSRNGLRLEKGITQHHSFIVLRGRLTQRLRFTCDVDMSHDAVLNFVFNYVNDGNFMMLRLDSRLSEDCPNAVLRSTQRYDWKFVLWATPRKLPANAKFPIEIEIDIPQRLFRLVVDGTPYFFEDNSQNKSDLFGQIKLGTKVGFFNEKNSVQLSNVKIELA